MLRPQNKPLPYNWKKPHPGTVKRLSLLLILLLWLAALAVAAANRQNILDWWALRSYHAPAAIAQLATEDTMTAYARKIFYVNHPLIDDKTSFAAVCPASSREQTIVLGCYHNDQAGIFLLQVADPRLNGVQQVTAAHEMLHAAYDRLSTAERRKVDGWLMDYYNHDLHDQRIIDTMSAYKRTEPNDVVNEMHSVFGTEIANLPSQLESYYSRYFTNRPTIAAAAAQYQAEFTSRQAAVVQDDTQLASWKAQIASQQNDLKAKQAQINALQTQLLAERSSDTSAYNAGVPVFNSLIDNFNSEVQSVQNLVSSYNQLVAMRNAVALEEDQLVNDLSSSATPISH